MNRLISKKRATEIAREWVYEKRTCNGWVVVRPVICDRTRVFSIESEPMGHKEAMLCVRNIRRNVEDLIRRGEIVYCRISGGVNNE